MMPKPTPRPSPLLRRLIDDELDRAALLVRELIAAAVEAPSAARRAVSFDDRMRQGSLQAALASGRDRAVAAFVAALREQVDASQAAAAPPPAAADPGALALVGDDEVAVDVAVSRTIEAIGSVAEYELREFAAYVAALMGDVDMAQPSNPLGAEVYARALWSAVQALPLAREHQLALMERSRFPSRSWCVARMLRHRRGSTTRASSPPHTAR